MVWIRLLLFLLVFYLVKANEMTRSCAQCVSGDFLYRRHLMQDSSVGMSMGWVNEWKETNCAKGNIRLISCTHACVKITLVKLPKEEDNSVEGIMMDCSDDLIHASPDLPKGIDFKAYDENATFTNRRRNFSITYTFSMDSTDDAVKIREDHSEIILPYYKEDYQPGTIGVYIFFFFLFISFIVGGVICCFRIQKEEKEHRKYLEDLELQEPHEGEAEKMRNGAVPAASLTISDQEEKVIEN
ncbi:hypothetical protein CRE_01717 [Caenorhabditis remanei]|uniref:Uncharacterized protein n=1 Tax=Caenorhabditis remanei TaxID=31234 RepID=E3LF35_CAERE|nr:hypothetical protein CRE_01717 [Caenorhabditis remanei]